MIGTLFHSTSLTGHYPLFCNHEDMQPSSLQADGNYYLQMQSRLILLYLILECLGQQKLEYILCLPCRLSKANIFHISNNRLTDIVDFLFTFSVMLFAMTYRCSIILAFTIHLVYMIIHITLCINSKFSLLAR